jgi:hypothetical protein
MVEFLIILTLALAYGFAVYLAFILARAIARYNQAQQTFYSYLYSLQNTPEHPDTIAYFDINRRYSMVCACGETHLTGHVYILYNTGTNAFMGACPQGHRFGHFMPPMGYQLN